MGVGREGGPVGRPGAGSGPRGSCRAGCAEAAGREAVVRVVFVLEFPPGTCPVRPRVAWAPVSRPSSHPHPHPHRAPEPRLPPTGHPSPSPSPLPRLPQPPSRCPCSRPTGCPRTQTWPTRPSPGACGPDPASAEEGALSCPRSPRAVAGCGSARDPCCTPAVSTPLQSAAPAQAHAWDQHTWQGKPSGSPSARTDPASRRLPPPEPVPGGLGHRTPGPEQLAQQEAGGAGCGCRAQAPGNTLLPLLEEPPDQTPPARPPGCRAPCLPVCLLRAHPALCLPRGQAPSACRRRHGRGGSALEFSPR